MSRVTEVAMVGQRWMDGDHMDGGWWWLMGIGMLLVVALIALLVFFLVRESSRSGGASRSSARDLLDQRFARGEIDEEEYRQRREVLGG